MVLDWSPQSRYNCQVTWHSFESFSRVNLPKRVLGSLCKTSLRLVTLLEEILPTCPRVTSYGKVRTTGTP
jgi:hypothetical protein